MKTGNATHGGPTGGGGSGPIGGVGKTPKGAGGSGPIGGGGPSADILKNIAKQLKDLSRLFSELSRTRIG